VNKSVIVLTIAAALVAVVVGAMATRFGTDPKAVASPLVGTPVADLELPYLEGEGSVKLADAGGDILVVNFWASWCLPCRSEHPLLVETARRWESAGVRIVGVVYQDSVDQATSFLGEFGRGFENVIDDGGRAAIAFGVFGIPETFFVDRDGLIAGVVRGPIDGATLESALEKLLVETALTG
jgi:cytochrome c biogenesis protein CcmG/thiol:disulfide interchange protein DsbE